MKTKNCFIGIEAEGPLRGINTLFVPGDTSPERLSEVLQRIQGQNILALYYGAGGDANLRADTIKYIAEWRLTAARKATRIRYITHEFVFLWSRRTFVEVSNLDADGKTENVALFEKIVNDVITIWTKVTVDTYSVLLNDRHFKSDEEIT